MRNRKLDSQSSRVSAVGNRPVRIYHFPALFVGVVRSIIVATLFVAGSLFATLALAETDGTSPTEQSQKPPAIRVIQAGMHELVQTLAVNGTVVARQEAEIGSDLSGIIVVDVFADQGDTVKNGDVLARLERTSLEIQMAQNRAQRAQAEATVSQVATQVIDAEVAVRQSLENLERAKKLQKKGFAARSQYDNAVNARDSAQAKLETARRALVASDAQIGLIDAQKRDIELKLAKTEVKAPADGLVLAREAALGELITQQTGALFRMAIDSKFELSAEVAETSLPKLTEGMAVSVSLAGLTSPLEGKIRLISPEIDARTRMGKVRISLPQDRNVRSGNYASGTIEILRRTGIAVPASAVVYRGKDAFLQTVENGVVVTKPVTLGIRARGQVEVTNGVGEGEVVVERAGTFVTDGDRVTPITSDTITGAVSR